jgi:hypothetical protein
MTADIVRAAVRACFERSRDLLPAARGRLACARTLAAYLAVVELELPAPQVRRALGWRRADLDAACLDVEELREDPHLDDIIAAAAADLRVGYAPRPPAVARARASVEALNAQRSARAARRALELLIAAGGDVVRHEAFGSAGSARIAICAARKTIGGGAIRTVRGEGFQITEAGLKSLRAKLSQFGEAPDSGDVRWLRSPLWERIAA